MLFVIYIGALTLACVLATANLTTAANPERTQTFPTREQIFAGLPQPNRQNETTWILQRGGVTAIYVEYTQNKKALFIYEENVYTDKTETFKRLCANALPGWPDFTRNHALLAGFIKHRVAPIIYYNNITIQNYKLWWRGEKLTRTIAFGYGVDIPIIPAKNPKQN